MPHDDFIYPVIGILIAGWYVRYVVRDNISHGVTRVLHAISSNKSRLKGHNVYSSVVASSITIGFGGSVGSQHYHKRYAGRAEALALHEEELHIIARKDICDRCRTDRRNEQGHHRHSRKIEHQNLQREQHHPHHEYDGKHV